MNIEVGGRMVIFRNPNKYWTITKIVDGYVYDKASWDDSEERIEIGEYKSLIYNKNSPYIYKKDKFSTRKERLTKI